MLFLDIFIHSPLFPDPLNPHTIDCLEQGTVLTLFQPAVLEGWQMRKC